jgi:hypothetical protein
VSHAFVQDVAASSHYFQQVAATLVEPAPAPLILHVAGPTDEGFRINAISICSASAATAASSSRR